MVQNSKLHLIRHHGTRREWLHHGERSVESTSSVHHLHVGAVQTAEVIRETVQHGR